MGEGRFLWVIILMSDFVREDGMGSWEWREERGERREERKEAMEYERMAVAGHGGLAR